MSEQNKGMTLEALRHSQTRGRELENVAKEAYVEQENLLKVILRQASELQFFACRQ